MVVYLLPAVSSDPIHSFCATGVQFFSTSLLFPLKAS